MEELMRRLVPVLMQESTRFIQDCVKWTLVGVVCLVCMWFLTDGLPQVVKVIIDQTSTSVAHLSPAQLNFPHPSRSLGGAQ